MNLHSRGGLARSTLLNMFGFAVFGVAGFGLLLVITHKLGRHDGGVFLEAIAIFTLGSKISILGTDIALVRFISAAITRGEVDRIPRLYRTALLPVVFVSSGLAVLIYFGSSSLGAVLANGTGEEMLAGYLRTLSWLLPISALYLAIEGASRGYATMLPGVIVERCARSIAVPVAIALVGTSIREIGLAWGLPFVAAAVVMSLWSARLFRSTLADFDHPPAPPVIAAEVGSNPVPDPEPTADFRFNRPSNFWRFALPRSIAGLFAVAITWIDSLLLGALASSSDVSVYVTAVRWLLVGNLAGNAVTLAVGPKLARLVTLDDRDRLRSVFQEAAGLMVLLSWPAYLSVMIFGPVLMKVFGAGFEGGSQVIVLTGIGFLAASAAGPIDMLVIMAGRGALSVLNSGVALSVNVIGNLLLIPHLGPRGAAIAWSLSLVIANWLPILEMWRLLRIHPWGHQSLRALGLCALIGLVGLVVRSLLGTNWLGLVTTVTLGVGIIAAGVGFSSDRLGLAGLTTSTRDREGN